MPKTAAPPEKKSTKAIFSAFGAPFGGAAMVGTEATIAIAPTANTLSTK
jgi:hypothetical protein